MLGWGGAGPPGRAGTLGCPPPSACLILGVYVHLSVDMIMTWSPRAWHLALPNHLSKLINMMKINSSYGVWVTNGFATVELFCHPVPLSVLVSMCDESLRLYHHACCCHRSLVAEE